MDQFEGRTNLLVTSTETCRTLCDMTEERCVNHIRIGMCSVGELWSVIE